MYSGFCSEGLSGFASEVGDQGPERGMDMAWGQDTLLSGAGLCSSGPACG